MPAPAPAPPEVEPARGVALTLAAKGLFILSGLAIQLVVPRLLGTTGYGELARDRFNVLLVGSYQKDEALYGRQRDFARSGINEGALNDTSSGNTFPANIVLPDGRTLNPAAPDCAPSVVSPLFPPTRCRYDPSPEVSLAPERLLVLAPRRP